MALANKGIALCRYSFLLGKRWKTILIDAHYFISKGLELGVIPESRKSFLIWLEWIEKQFEDKNVLKNHPKFPGYQIKAESEVQKFLKKFTMDYKLYLNVCDFCQKCNYSIGDNINIENNPLKDFYIEKNIYINSSSHLNQIKEDFIAARSLLLLSQYNISSLDFIYNDAIFVDTLDNTHHQLKIQLLRISFKNFFDILDKIAFFINDYLSLNIKPDFMIDFRKIWYSPWKKQPKKSKINPHISNTNSYGLNALFDIHWDFEKGEPYNDLRMTRNALTHRFVKIRDCDENTNEEMQESHLFNQTVKLAGIVRNAIFYLMYFVNENEKKKAELIKI